MEIHTSNDRLLKSIEPELIKTVVESTEVEENHEKEKHVEWQYEDAIAKSRLKDTVKVHPLCLLPNKRTDRYIQKDKEQEKKCVCVWERERERERERVRALGWGVI